MPMETNSAAASTRVHAIERVAKWPKWKQQAGDAFMDRLREDARIIRERMEHTSQYGEQ